MIICLFDYTLELHEHRITQRNRTNKQRNMLGNSWHVLNVDWRLGLPFAFAMFLPSLLHSRRALLLCYRGWSKRC